jgi:nucleoside-diphosphate-sugar epimerase
MTTPSLHVVFGAGSLGYATAAALVARGHTVRVASRSGRGELPPGATSVIADASDPAAVAEAAAGARAIYCCAAPPYTDWPALFPKLQAGLLEGAARSGAALICAENVYIYGAATGDMTEQTPWTPCSRKGELRAKLNRELLEAHEAGKVRVALGRGPDYYGPRAAQTTVWGDQVFPAALKGKRANLFGKLDVPHTWIYVDDFARGLVTLGERDEALGEVWHLPCPAPMTQRELLQLVYEAAGHKPGANALPGAITRMIGWFVPIMRELGEMQYQWEQPYIFKHDKFDRAFSPEAPVPHAQAVRLTLDWFRDHYKP